MRCWVEIQAKNIQTKEIVAVKKMSFQGRQSSEVCTAWVLCVAMWSVWELDINFELNAKMIESLNNTEVHQ